MQVHFEISNDIALIQLDDGKKNAITHEAAAQILAALDEAEAGARAIVLAGRPGAFCAGFDLATMTSGDAEAIDRLAKGGGRILLRLYGMGKPLVAACTGHAFTIGALWLTACDTRIGEAGDYKFGMTETAMGMPLPPFGVEPLKARLAPTMFVQVLAQSRILDPEGARQAGFLDEIVPAGEALDRALSTARELANLPARAYAANKLVVRQQALEIMAADLNG